MRKKLPEKYRPWIEARRRYQLSDAHVQMARELGLNPKKFGGLANTRQEPWKLPLPEFIEELYFQRFKILAPAWRSLLGSPEAHGRAEGAFPGALAVSGLALAACKSDEGSPLTVGPATGRYNELD
jgi:hypothetical protein